VKRVSGFLSLAIFVGGCALPPPYEDYTIARVAVHAARDAEALRYTPGLLNQAEEHYRRGEKDYTDNDYSGATEEFKSAIKFAERAETQSRVKKAQQGGGAP
jgi:hypothetical protein